MKEPKKVPGWMKRPVKRTDDPKMPGCALWFCHNEGIKRWRYRFCSRECLVVWTMDHINFAGKRQDHSIPCPLCGRWASDDAKYSRENEEDKAAGTSRSSEQYCDRCKNWFDWEDVPDKLMDLLRRERPYDFL